MITKAFIDKVIDENSCRVRIPIYHKLENAVGATPKEQLPIATICTIPGIKFAPQVGDVVFVDFELDREGSPIIIGYLSTANVTSTCNINANSLNVGINCKLPDQTYNDIDQHLVTTINGLQTQIDNMGGGGGGGVSKINTGDELIGGPITGIGTIAHQLSSVTAGTYPKVTVNRFGHITAGDNLTNNDIPNLDATKITSGTFADDRIASASTWNSKVNTSDIVDNVTTTIATVPLSANQGKVLNDRIDNLESIGRYLALWDCTTGKPTTNPTTMPYTYKAGDYYRVTTVGTTNYKPDGSTYNDVASTVEETDSVEIGDVYFYDGTNWTLQINHIGGLVTDVTVDGTSVVSGGVAAITGKENTSNKVTSLSSSSTDTQYPSAKCVYDIVGNVETLLSQI